MNDHETQIAWTALPKGHPIVGSDGDHVGKVTRVVADEQKDIFSGVAFRSGLLDHARFVPAALIAEITSEEVVLAIAAGEAEKLEHYEG